MKTDQGLIPWAIVVYAALMQAIVIGTSIYSFAFFVVPWMAEFQLERGTLMLAVTLSSLVAAAISPLCGILCDKYSSRKLVLSSSLVFAFGLLLIGITPSFTTIILVYALAFPLGACLSGTLMALTLVSKLFTHNRGLAMGLVVLGTNIGGLVMPLLVTKLLALYSWQDVFQILSVIVIFLVSVPALFLLKGIGEPAHQQTEQLSSGSALQVMRSAAVLKLGVAFLIPCLLFVAVLHNIGALAADLSISQQYAAWIIAAASIVMGLGKVAAGALSDRIDNRLLYVGCITLVGGGLIIVSFASNFSSLMIGVSLTALVMGGISPLIATIVAERWGAKMMGRVMGVVHAFAGASALGALLAGYLRDVTGDYSQVFMYLLLTIIPALYCMLTLPNQASSVDT